MRIVAVLLFGAIAPALAPSLASACQPTFNETWGNANSTTWVGDAGNCTLEARATAWLPTTVGRNPMLRCA